MVVRPRSSFIAVAASLLFLALSPPAHAETAAPTSRPTTGGLAVYLFAGHSGWDTTALDARLTSLGYGAFPQNPGSGGLGLRAWVDGSCQCTGDMEFQFADAGTGADQGRQLSLTAGQFMLHAGRTLFARGHVRTYAMLGLGYGATLLELDPGSLPARARNPLGFADGKQGASSYALALQALVGVDYLVPFGGHRSKGFDGVLVGLRAGYNAQPLVTGWSATSGSGPSASSYAVDLPRVAADGAFVHLVFGDLALAR